MSADLDALDRGLVDVGVTAAEALARVVALEAKVAALETGLRAACTAAGLPMPQPGPGRHLQVVSDP